MFWVWPLTAVVAIALTFVVFPLALRDLQDLTGQAAVADFLLHSASPVLCVTGWLLHGPRRQTSPQVITLTLAFVFAWGGLTLVRGETTGWYPYPFMDVVTHGYARVTVNLTVIGTTFVALATGAHWLDRKLPGRRVE